MTHVKLWCTYVCVLILLSPQIVHGNKGITAAPNPADVCPRGLSGPLEVFKCKCYEFQKTRNVWGNGRCTINGGHLAKIDTEEINDFLVKKCRDHIPDQTGVWIGASRESKDYPFYWTDGTLVEYVNWADYEPNDDLLGLPQNCVYLKRVHLWRWANQQCIIGHSLPSICQYDIANCTIGGSENSGQIETTLLIVIIVCSVVGAIFVCLIICCIVSRCRSAYSKYHKRKTQRRSVRYYSRPPSTARQSAIDPRCQAATTSETGENDLNERLVRGAEADDNVLNVKGSSLPTASSIAAEAAERQGLVVDMSTGRATVKRVNAAADACSSSSPKSYPMDATDRHLPHMNLLCDGGDGGREREEPTVFVSNNLTSEEEDDCLSANLDNVEKSWSHTSKDILYK